MKVIIENFNKVIPEDMTPCVLLEKYGDKPSVFFGVYEKRTNSFFDGIGGHEDIDNNEHIIGWKPIWDAKIEE